MIPLGGSQAASEVSKWRLTVEFYINTLEPELLFGVPFSTAPAKRTGGWIAAPTETRSVLDRTPQTTIAQRATSDQAQQPFRIRERFVPDLDKY